MEGVNDASVVSNDWKRLKENPLVLAFFNKLADLAGIEHGLAYPDYKYKPNRKDKKGRREESLVSSPRETRELFHLNDQSNGVDEESVALLEVARDYEAQSSPEYFSDSSILYSGRDLSDPQMIGENRYDRFNTYQDSVFIFSPEHLEVYSPVSDSQHPGPSQLDLTSQLLIQYMDKSCYNDFSGSSSVYDDRSMLPLGLPPELFKFAQYSSFCAPIALGVNQYHESSLPPGHALDRQYQWNSSEQQNVRDEMDYTQQIDYFSTIPINATESLSFPESSEESSPSIIATQQLSVQDGTDYSQYSGEPVHIPIQEDENFTEIEQGTFHSYTLFHNQFLQSCHTNSGGAHYNL
ncbi:2742_t:CDS:1 [Acaulospora colombiana]|uniref:2742_t:CDS:1 n=1 Tax=Acaulospora colombiana TaxID=27376 RepID=A0ACA9KPA5_9GLOM|nr:2742_t:CDS:1 [Acaulospora colombiana]